MTYPKQSPTVHVEHLQDELCIYDWHRHEVHTLNATAARVWQLCDGQTSPTQMAQTIQAEFHIPHAEEVVGLALSHLSTAQLLQEPLVVPVKHQAISRRKFLQAAGIAAAALLPTVSSIVAPLPVAAQ